MMSLKWPALFAATVVSLAIACGAGAADYAAPCALVAGKDGQHLYVAECAAKRIAVIDTALLFGNNS